MSISQQEITEFNTSTHFIESASLTKHQATETPQSQEHVFELFTVKTKSENQQKKSKSIDSAENSVLSDEVFVKSKPVSISTPSKSEGKSYRDKINERFRTIKEKAGKSTKKASTFKDISERILVERVRKESKDVDAELESVRSKFNLQTQKNYGLHDFFCVEKTDSLVENGNTSTEDLTNNKDLFFDSPGQWRLIIKKGEEELFYKPTAQAVEISDKIEQDEPRHLDKEGFYVANDPKIPTQHLNILEQRLLRDSKKWFNCEGKLNIVENPIQKKSFRPETELAASDQTLIFIRGKIDNCECDEVVIIRENILHLQIGKLKFTHHPLYSLEHVFEQKLRLLFQKYQQNASSNNKVRASRRLEALRHILKHSDEISSQSGEADKDDKTKAYNRDVKELHEIILDESKKERLLIKSILDTWKTIKNIRNMQNYSNTKIRLIIKKEKVDDYENEKITYEKRLEEYIEDLLLEQSTETDDNAERNELLERFKESFRPPGEPILSFSLTEDNEITTVIENSKEISRRNTVSSTKVALKIVCNKLEVLKTRFINLNDDFFCNFDEQITIQLLTVPKFVTIEVIEQPRPGSLMKAIRGQISLQIPSRDATNDTIKPIKRTFTKNDIIHYKHAGVGSGLAIKEIIESPQLAVNDADEQLNTSGYVNISISWDSRSFFDEKYENEESKVINDIINKNGAIDLEKLSEWMHQNKPDPQDPKNSILYEYSLRNHDGYSSEQKKYFRLNPFLDSLQFCDYQVLEDNLRLKILQLRNNNEPEFDRMVVPNRIKEIPQNILEDFNKRIASEQERFYFEMDEEEEELEKKRNHGRQRLKQIYTKVFHKCRNTQNNLTFDDVVDEKLLNYFEKLVKDAANSFLNWFRWHPLTSALPEIRRTVFKDSKRKEPQIFSQVKIVLKIISGLNLPERENKSDLKPFVEIICNNIIERTSTSQGRNPTWNEEKHVPLDPSQVDYLSPNSLNGVIVLNLFDECENTLTKLGGMKDRTWLGCVEVPITAVCYNEMEGMFKLQTSQLVLGYNVNGNKSKSPKAQTHPNQQTYLHLKVTVEPNIPKLSPSMEELPSSDVPYIVDYALRWNENYNSNFPNRKFSVFAIDANATTTCIVRYIKALEPPKINPEGFDIFPDQCVRYVSLIPFTDYHHFYQNIWLTADQFLNLMSGSIIDHAILLTCYLLALRQEAWLLLGFGVPYGSTAFVLIREYDNNQMIVYYIYDVVKSEKYDLADSFCPLQKIYCVVNEQNVWANIQRNDNINITRFDFTKRSDWLPLFNNQITAPTKSVHGKIVYGSILQIDEFEATLDRRIKKKISKLRQLDRTIWNHHVSNVFKSALSSFENSAMFGKSNSETLIKLRECAKTFLIKGHVFSIPFTNISSIVKKVKSIGLNLEDGSDTQFASAVYLKPYPNQVIAAWIFIASIKESLH